MRKSILLTVALFALVGIIHCVLIEPALAYQEDCQASEGAEEAHCCFVCSPSHHQWFPSQVSANSFDTLSWNDLIHATTHLSLDSPVRPIFHVPLVRL